jgi:hypothetical protein
MASAAPARGTLSPPVIGGAGPDGYGSGTIMEIRGAGGTPGGIGEFFLGLALTGLGFYLFLDRVSVMSTFSSLWGGHFGLVLLPLGLGVALLFFNGKSVLGWLLSIGSLGAVFLSIIMNLTFYFQATNFFRTAGMISLMAIGLVMMARSLRAKPA